MVSDRAQFTTRIRMTLDATPLTRGLSGVTQDLRRTESASDRLTRSVDQMGREARSTGGDVDRLGDRLSALRGVIGTLAGAFAGAFAFDAGLDRLREIRDIQRELGGANAQIAQQVIVGAQAGGFDPGNLAGAIFDATERAQEQLAGTVNLDLSGFGLEADAFAQSLLNAGNETERLRFLLDTLNRLPTGQRLAFLAETAGGSAQAIALLANDADLARTVLGAMNDAATQSDASLARLADAQESFAELKNAVSILAGTFSGALTPAIQLAANVLTPLANAFGRLQETSPVLATALSVGMVGALLAVTTGFGALTTAIRISATAARAHPILAIAGILLAVLVPAINFLSERLGGFANLWASVWDGVVIVALTAVRAALTPLSLFLDTLNAISRAISAISGGSIDLPQIANPVRQIDAEIADRAGNISQRAREASAAREGAVGGARQASSVTIQTSDTYNVSANNPEEFADALDLEYGKRFSLAELGR